jgi:hypothetical protein
VNASSRYRSCERMLERSKMILMALGRKIRILPIPEHRVLTHPGPQPPALAVKYRDPDARRTEIDARDN